MPWELPREKLYIRQKIGEGSFGEVWRARVQDGILGRDGEQLVAVKMLRGQFHFSTRPKETFRPLHILESFFRKSRLKVYFRCFAKKNFLE